MFILFISYTNCNGIFRRALDFKAPFYDSIVHHLLCVSHLDYF